MGEKSDMNVPSHASSWAISLRLSLKQGTTTCRNSEHTPALYTGYTMLGRFTSRNSLRLFLVHCENQLTSCGCIYIYTVHNLRCCFMRRVPGGPHTPCTAQPGAGTRGAGQLLASAGRGLGHSSRSPPGTFAP